MTYLKRFMVAAGAALVLGACGTPPTEVGGSAQPQATPPVDIPPQAQQRAIGTLSGHYGPPSFVYGEAETTAAEWARLEPQSPVAVDPESYPPDAPIYAVFLRGSFVAETVMHGQEVQIRYVAVRAVFDEDGSLLKVDAEKKVIPVTPPFGPSFDE